MEAIDRGGEASSEGGQEEATQYSQHLYNPSFYARLSDHHFIWNKPIFLILFCYPFYHI
jgi:hypothetical protein